jgi:predicted SnoaL-like aldol condensation-catalyzing enzyme
VHGKFAAIAGFVVAAILIHPDGASAQRVTAAQMEANKKLVLEFYRNVWEPQRLDAMKDYYDQNIIEHNPNVKSGIQGFAETMGRRWQPKPVQATLQNPPAMVLADGDTVTLVFKRARPDPADPTKMYDTFWFDMFRIKNGKVVEHWDAATRPVSPPPRS